MSSIALVEPGHSKLDYIKRQITAGYDRANKGGAEWVEGSLIAAAALREGRELIPANVTFSEWLKQNKLDFYSHHDRAALISMAADLGVMRTVLTETDSRSYQRMWGANKSRFTRASKTTESKTNTTTRHGKPRKRLVGRAMNHRRMKLGDAVIDSLKGTSLDSAIEMDELVRLNRSAPEGELTEEVRKIVTQACAGKDVSAIAYAGELMPVTTRKRPSLTEAWRKRMVFVWEQANYDEQQKFLEYLMEHMRAKS